MVGHVFAHPFGSREMQSPIRMETHPPLMFLLSSPKLKNTITTYLFNILRLGVGFHSHRLCRIFRTRDAQRLPGAIRFPLIQQPTQMLTTPNRPQLRCHRSSSWMLSLALEPESPRSHIAPPIMSGPGPESGDNSSSPPELEQV